MSDVSERYKKRIETLKDLANALCGVSTREAIDLAGNEVRDNAKTASALLGKLEELMARDLRAEEERRANKDAIGTLLAAGVEGGAKKRSTDDDDFDVPLAEDTRSLSLEASALLGKVQASLRHRNALIIAEVEAIQSEIEGAYGDTKKLIEQATE